jgi:cytoskeletal protein CcmA (bactofilin family)
LQILRVCTLVLVLLATFGGAAAAADLRQGNTVTVGPGETVDDDLYAFGGSVTIQGTVKGDVVASGGNVTIDGTVTGSVTAAGGTLSIGGQVGGSVRAAGGNASVTGRVGGDVVIAGGTLTLGPNSQVGRDLVIGSGTATVSGQVLRDLRGGGGSLTIAGRVGRDVRVEVDTLELTGGANVDGSMTYTSAREAVIASGARVKGQVQRQEPERTAQTGPSGTVFDWVRTLVGFLAFGLLVVLLVPGFARRTTDALTRSTVVSIAIGAGLLVGAPILALIVFVVGALAGGWWIGLIVLALYGIAIAASLPLAAFAAGSWLLRYIGRPAHDAVALFVGLVALLLVGFVPVIGGLVLLLASLAGLGALAMTLSRLRTPTSARS